MSVAWPGSSSDDLTASVVIAVVLLAILVMLLSDDDRRPRESSIRLASPAFVALSVDDAQLLARDLGAAFREYMRQETEP